METNTIPKVIHYCWFSGNPLPPLAKKCIVSWKKYAPDYKIIQWNEGNFDVNCCTYTKQAYAVKKYAFVSDYARFQILYQCGGVYFDTDVELLQPIDPLIKEGPFMGQEAGPDGEKLDVKINPGLGFSAFAGMPLYREILAYYDTLSFLKEDGTPNLTTIVEHTTSILLRHGMRNSPDLQTVCGVKLYPTEYFCPFNFYTGERNITKNTYSIHHYVASWATKSVRGQCVTFLQGMLGKQGFDTLRRFYRRIKFGKQAGD